MQGSWIGEILPDSWYAPSQTRWGWGKKDSVCKLRAHLLHVLLCSGLLCALRPLNPPCCNLVWDRTAAWSLSSASLLEFGSGTAQTHCCVRPKCACTCDHTYTQRFYLCATAASVVLFGGVAFPMCAVLLLICRHCTRYFCECVSFLQFYQPKFRPVQVFKLHLLLLRAATVRTPRMFCVPCTPSSHAHTLARAHATHTHTHTHAQTLMRFLFACRDTP